MKKQNVTGINFTSAELLARVKAAAKAEGRSFSNYVCRVLEKDLALPVSALRDEPASSSPAGTASALAAVSEDNERAPAASAPAALKYPPPPHRRRVKGPSVSAPPAPESRRHSGNK